MARIRDDEAAGISTPHIKSLRHQSIDLCIVGTLSGSASRTRLQTAAPLRTSWPTGRGPVSVASPCCFLHNAALLSVRVSGAHFDLCILILFTTPTTPRPPGGGLPLQPAVNARGLLLDEGPLECERLPPPGKYKLVSSLGRARVMGTFTLNQLRCESAVLRFPRAEVEAVKARAMAGLEGACRVCVRVIGMI